MTWMYVLNTTVQTARSVMVVQPDLIPLYRRACTLPSTVCVNPDMLMSGTRVYESIRR